MQGKKMSGFVTRERALKDFFAAWQVEDKIEVVPIDEACKRITAEDVYSVQNLPVHRVSAFDGIAVKSENFKNGFPDYTTWVEGIDYVRADTGDDFPDDFDAVIMVEEIKYDNGKISYISPDLTVKPGDNTINAGSIVAEGDLIIEKNMPLRPTDVSTLVLGGINMIKVYRRPVVAFLPTGSELIPASAMPKRGENIDTNSILVKETIKELGGVPLIYPITNDNKKLLMDRLLEAVSMSDIVIINAGSAKGSEDFNFDIIGERGRLIHHYIAAAPGRPMALAVIDGKPVINLPGPMRSAYMGLDWCVSATINRILHQPSRIRKKVEGMLMRDIHAAPGMEVFFRVKALKQDDGSIHIYPYSYVDDSYAYIMTSNAMYMSKMGESVRKKGEMVEVELLRGEELLSISREL